MVRFYLRQQKCLSPRNKNNFLLYWVGKTVTQLCYCFFIKTSSKFVLTWNSQSIGPPIFSEEQPKFCLSRKNKNSDLYYHWLRQLPAREEATKTTCKNKISDLNKIEKKMHPQNLSVNIQKPDYTIQWSLCKVFLCHSFF